MRQVTGENACKDRDTSDGDCLEQELPVSDEWMCLLAYIAYHRLGYQQQGRIWPDGTCDAVTSSCPGKLT
jgi:hypothetical protein